jgi:hypothetical protein
MRYSGRCRREQALELERRLVRAHEVERKRRLVARVIREYLDATGILEGGDLTQEFGRPEVQLNHIHQSNFMTNNSLSISFELARNLESRAVPMRRKIEQLFASHPQHSGSPR